MERPRRTITSERESQITDGVRRRLPPVPRPRQLSRAKNAAGWVSRDPRPSGTESTSDKTHEGAGERIPESVTTILAPPETYASSSTSSGRSRSLRYFQLVPYNPSGGLMHNDFDSGICMPSAAASADLDLPRGSGLVFYAEFDADGMPSPASVSNNSSFESQSTEWARLHSIEFGSSRASTVELEDEERVAVGEHAHEDQWSSGRVRVTPGRGSIAGRQSVVLAEEIARTNSAFPTRPHSVALRSTKRRRLFLPKRADTAPVARRRVSTDSDVSRCPPASFRPVDDSLLRLMENAGTASAEASDVGGAAARRPPLTRQHAQNSGLIDFNSHSRGGRAQLDHSQSDASKPQGDLISPENEDFDSNDLELVGAELVTNTSSGQDDRDLEADARRSRETGGCVSSDGFRRNFGALEFSGFRPDDVNREESGRRGVPRSVGASGSRFGAAADGGDVGDSCAATNETALLRSVERAMSERGDPTRGASSKFSKPMHRYDSFEHFEDSLGDSGEHEVASENCAAVRRRRPSQNQPAYSEDGELGARWTEARSVSRNRRPSEAGSTGFAGDRCIAGDQLGDQPNREKNREPVRGLEVLDQVTKIELKRVGEEDETKEVLELQRLGLLHGSSSQLRDKFSDKITYNAKCLASSVAPLSKPDNRRGEGLSAADEDGYRGNDVGVEDDEPRREEFEQTNGAQRKALFYVTRKLRCVSAIALGHCTTGYRMKLLDKAGRAVLEIHKPCRFTPPFLRNLLPVCTEAEVFLVNSQRQDEGMSKPPVELLGKIKRRWSGGCLPKFTLHGVDGSAFATFRASRSKGFKIKFHQGAFNEGGQLCHGSDVEDIASRIVLAYPAELRVKPLLLGAAVYLSHYYRVGLDEAFGWLSCFCNTLSL